MKTFCINGLAHFKYNNGTWQSTGVPYKDYMKKVQYERNAQTCRERRHNLGFIYLEDEDEEPYISYERWSSLVKWTGSAEGWKPKDSYSKMIIETYSGAGECIADYI